MRGMFREPDFLKNTCEVIIDGIRLELGSPAPQKDVI